MEKVHRTALQKNRTFLIANLTNIETLVDKLMESDVCTPNMQQDIMVITSIEMNNINISIVRVCLWGSYTVNFRSNVQLLVISN